MLFRSVGNILLSIENLNGVMTVSTGGLAVNDLSQGFETFQVSTGGFTTIRSINSTSSPPLQILGYATTSPISPPDTGTLIHAVGQDGNPAQLLVDTFNNNPVSPGSAINFQGRASRGTHASPLAVQSGDNLSAFSARGYNGSGYGVASSLQFIAVENFSPSAQGTAMSVKIGRAHV